ncbi:hypothetical protein [Candidatus Lokiarchaeum ossiferum]|uniref:hypothetical protein n=1 Tax=Candidatus Lokiarchaeum ossiferum TaxID=2951803 RepID=UPI00352D54A4
MQVIKNQLFYCTECYHVFYDLPSEKKCAICHNEILEQDTISDLDILTCETCHSLYTLQKSGEIILNKEGNINHLCSCKHQCPTNSILSIGQQESYLGNIVLADIFKCSNCGAISFRNLENSQKNCSECNSRFVSPLHWDPKTQKTFFRCANPDHKIRLKLRDLIINNNKIISSEINKIKQKEIGLQKEYIRLKHELQVKYENKNLLKKIKSFQKGKLNFENDQNNLNIWAKIERLKLYSYLRPIGLRCSVYRMKNDNDKISFERTSDGCGAIAHLKIRKIIIAPDGTVIERKSEPKQGSPGQIEKDLLLSSSTLNVEGLKINHPIPKWINESEISLVNDQSESIFTQILRNQPITENPIQVENQVVMTEEVIRNAYDSLPDLKENQLYIFFQIKFKKMDSENYTLDAFGVIPIEFEKNNFRFQLGRKHLLQAFWKEQSRIEKNPLYFNGITESTEESYQFGITQRENEMFLLPGKNNLSKNLISAEENAKSELIKEISIQKINKLTINGKYAYNKPHERTFSNIQFIFSFKQGGISN